ncbi:UDP-N-acetylglucosamine transferase subunit alg14 [Glycine max]|nr:UDP-N-acetylglucosamine transferase subunit alg14 [Glycine max]
MSAIPITSSYASTFSYSAAEDVIVALTDILKLPLMDKSNGCSFSSISSIAVFSSAVFVVSLILVRLLYVLYCSSKPLSKRASKPFSTLIILGSGGHIAEMLNLLAVLQKGRFNPRFYIVVATDNMSLQKAQLLENSLAAEYVHDESETLSDIDDEEVDLYIHDEEGKHIKKILWETTYREYLEEQAAKEAAAAASKKAFEAKFENCSEDILAARELAASSTEAVAKSKKEMRQKRAYEAKNTRPAQSAAEAFGQMSNKKRDILAARELAASSTEAVEKSRKGLKSKVNFKLLNELFDEMDTQENTDGLKKQKKVPIICFRSIL